MLDLSAWVLSDVGPPPSPQTEEKAATRETKDRALRRMKTSCGYSINERRRSRALAGRLQPARDRDGHNGPADRVFVFVAARLDLRSGVTVLVARRF
jgi:hypothetical protein